MLADKLHNSFEEDFLYAQKLLLKEGQYFNDERKIFICDFENSFDVQAVPWSGKTTALLAKLIILEKNINKLEGGVLILSHTNKAIDNIKNRLWWLCPQLISSKKNFVGTVQNFVNDFLAKPYYGSSTWKKIQSIDDDYRVYKLKSQIGSKYYEGLDSKYCKYLNIGIKDDEHLAWEVNIWEDTDTYKKVLEAYKKLESESIFRFKDMFDFWNQYIKNHPLIIKILQKRFKYIFVDETQDLEPHQLNILLQIFDNSDSLIQKIWDINQSIFHEWSNEDLESLWIQKDYKQTGKPYFISWSHRLPNRIANITNMFQKDETLEKIIWNDCANEELEPKSTICIFKKWKEKEVIVWFINKLKEKWFVGNYNEKEMKVIGDEHNEEVKLRYSAIARTTKNKIEEDIEKNKIKREEGEDAKELTTRCMKHYFESFSKKSIKERRRSIEFFDTILWYVMNFDPVEPWLTQIRKMILYSMYRPIKGTKVKTIQWEKEISGVNFLLEIIKIIDNEKFKKFKKTIYKIACNIKNAKNTSDLVTQKDSIYNLFIWLLDFLAINRSVIPTNYNSSTLSNRELKNSHSNEKKNYHQDGYYLNFDSIHGAKGQDHEATIYLMTNYHKEDFKYFIDIIKDPKKSSKKNVIMEQKKYFMYDLAVQKNGYVMLFAMIVLLKKMNYY